MYILTNGRDELLSYLRNLTPQIVLLTILFLLSTRIDFHRADITNFGATFAFYSCAAILGFAWWANTSSFIDTFIKRTAADSPRYGKVFRRLERISRRGTTALQGTLIYICRTRPFLIVDVIVSIVLMNIGFIAIVVSAANATKAALR